MNVTHGMKKAIVEGLLASGVTLAAMGMGAGLANAAGDDIGQLQMVGARTRDLHGDLRRGGTGRVGMASQDVAHAAIVTACPFLSHRAEAGPATGRWRHR